MMLVNYAIFIKKKPSKVIKNIYYIGSFYKGRGIELIEKLASKNEIFQFLCIWNER